MILTTDNLLERLEHNLASTERLDVAVAWAGPGKAVTRVLDFARDNPNRVRLIVGISGNATYPRTLSDLHSLAQLRLPLTYPLFHPKVFIFQQKDRTVAWVGSANLTRCGFEQNSELVSEVIDDGSVARWFEDEWAVLGADPSHAIEQYTSGWRPPAPPAGQEGAADASGTKVSDQRFGQLLQNVSDWRSFVAALRVANGYWQRRHGFSVDGETSSRLNTITLGNEIVRRESWRDLSKNDYQLLMGIEVKVEGVSSCYGLLGSMRGAGDAKNVFNEASPQNLRTREEIRRALRPVLGATAAEFPEAAVEFIRRTDALQGFSGGVATRLLALARPDLAVTVNNGSRKRLAAWSGLPATALSKPPSGPRAASYGSLLRFLAQQSWYANPEPRGAYERSLANARAALLDCLVYSP